MEPQPTLPPGWIRVESKKRPGNFYYFHEKSGKSSWEFPVKAEAVVERPPTSKKRSLGEAGPLTIEARSDTGIRRIFCPARRSLPKEEKTVCVVPPQKVLSQNQRPPVPGESRPRSKAVTGRGPSVVLEPKAKIQRVDSRREVKQPEFKPPMKKSTSAPTLAVLKEVAAALTRKPLVKGTSSSRLPVASANSRPSAIVLKTEPGVEPTLYPTKTSPGAFKPSDRRSPGVLCRTVSISTDSLGGPRLSRRPSVGGNVFVPYSVHVKEEEGMDWESVPEEKVTESIQEIRKNVSFSATDAEMKSVSSEPLQVLTNNLWIVVDTNIFLSHLSTVTRLKEIAERGVVQLTMIAPWVVISELDYLKRDNQLQHLARKAGKLIQTSLERKQPGLAVQTALDAREASNIFESNVNDDKILQCCLHLQQKGCDVVLLSNDNMLLTKAMGHSIKALSKDDIAKQISELVVPRPVERQQNVVMDSRQLAVMIEDLLLPVFREMIETRFKQVFEDLWKRIICVKPPFTELKQVFQVLNKHWLAVFGELYNRRIETEVRSCRELFMKAKIETLNCGEVKEMIGYFVNFLEASKTKFEFRQTLQDCISLIRAYQEEYERAQSGARPISQSDLDSSGSIMSLFQSIWGTIHQACGTISELLGIPYLPFEPFPSQPSVEDARDILPHLKVMVKKLEWQVSAYLANPRDPLVSVEFFTFLITFLPKLGIGCNPPGTENLSQHHISLFVSEEDKMILMRNAHDQVKGFCDQISHFAHRMGIGKELCFDAKAS